MSVKYRLLIKTINKSNFERTDNSRPELVWFSSRPHFFLGFLMIGSDWVSVYDAFYMWMWRRLDETRDSTNRLPRRIWCPSLLCCWDLIWRHRERQDLGLRLAGCHGVLTGTPPAPWQAQIIPTSPSEAEQSTEDGARPSYVAGPRDSHRQ